jgi:ribonuclease HII
LKNSKALRSVNWTRFLPAPVIGVDEVGRGCLAGPVVAAAVVLSRPTRRRMFFDSKTVSGSRRGELSQLIHIEHRCCVAFASVEEIDHLNILHASLLAMRRAVEGLGLSGGHVLVDGKFRIPNLIGFEQTPLIQGDSRAEPISAASIAAKVARDTWMCNLAEQVPGYGFEIHKGYGTPFHRARLAELGPSVFHRRAFSGVKEWLAAEAEDPARAGDGDLGAEPAEEPGMDGALP